MRKLLPALVLAAALPVAAQPAPPATETVTSRAAPLPDEVVTGFVKTYTAPSLLTGKIPRWAQGICLKTQGLAKELSDAVSARILAIAADVGAPVQKPPCGLNVVIIFDPDPQGVMDDIAANHEELLGPHDKAQIKDVSRVRHPIQAWYATGTRDAKGIWQADTTQAPIDCDMIDKNVETGIISLSGGGRVDPAKYQQVLTSMARYCNRQYSTGTRLKNGITSEFAAVTIVAGLDTVKYHELGALADYIALLALSQTEAFDSCQKMETVANLLVPGCDPGNRINGLMPGDTAFLKALYHADMGGTLGLQQSAIANAMKKGLAER
jgi:hypothetical protein